MFCCTPLFFFRPIVRFQLQVVEFCETVSGPRLTRADVTVMNKDYFSGYLQSLEIIKAAENSWG